MMRTKGAVILIFMSTGSIDLYGQDETIRYTDLANRLTDLKALAELPAEGEGSAMWSSYDRRSKVDPETGAFIDWSANDDGYTPQYIRKEGENMILAEMEGPGAIVRMWSANPAKGHVKIYIDGKEAPAVDLPFIDYFDTTSIPIFNYSQLVYQTAALGYNNYVPITYQRSCKIVAEPGWGQYYHFNYISFPQGTKVEKFEASPDAEVLKALNNVNSFFQNRIGELPYETSHLEEKNLNRKIAPGDSQTIVIKGRKAIYAIEAMVEIADEKRMDEALRKMILQITWDNEDEPAVWSPLGDFFGSAPGYNIYKTLPMGMTKEAMYSYWYMPFGQSATITLINHFDQPVNVNFNVRLEELSENGMEYGRFHAKWHRNLSAPGDSIRWPDWTVLETTGTGRFLGMSLMIWNPKGGSCRAHASPGHHWWGEGDEKFFVDGEAFPSTFGTGTEDYFGYAWCKPDYFTHPFHSQSHTDGNMGYQSVNRWQVIDNIPFQTSFDGYVEKYFPDSWPTQYAVTTYWYLNEGGRDPIEPTPVGELYGFEKPYEVYREPEVIEGEGMRIVENTGGWGTADYYAHETLYDTISGHKILLWHGKPDAENKLITTFEVGVSGKHKVSAHVAKSPEGGKFRISINGNKIDKVFDMKSDIVPANPELIYLGVFEFQKGEQTMKIEWIPADDSGTQLMMDYLKLEPM